MVSVVKEWQGISGLLPDGLVLVDREGLIVFASTVAESMFGYPAGALTGQPIEVLVPQRNRGQHVGHRQQYAAEPRTRVMGGIGMELHGRRKDGTEFPVDIALAPIDQGDDPVTLALIRDVTARQQMEVALHERELRLRAILETARDAIIGADQEGHVTYWNPAAATMFGYTAEEMKGQPLSGIMPERFREAHETGLRRFAHTGESRVIGRVLELAGLRKDGHEFPLELSLASWKDGERVMIAAIIRDTTQRKAKNDTILEQKAALEKQIQLMLGREERVLELKREVNELLGKLGMEQRYRT